MDGLRPTFNVLYMGKKTFLPKFKTKNTFIVNQNTMDGKSPNSLTDGNTEIQKKTEFPNVMNSYFCSVGEGLADKIERLQTHFSEAITQ